MRLTRCLSNAGAQVLRMLDFYSQFNPSPLTIQQFIDFGTKHGSSRNSFLFLRKELPVRLANIMKEIRLLPDSLLMMPSVQQVDKWYEQSFNEILEYEKTVPDNDSILEKFSQTLVAMRNRHSTVVETMAEGVKEMKENLGTISMESDVNLDGRVQYFLDRFYLNRISIRMLIHQHLLLFSEAEIDQQHIGCIDPNCDILAIAEDASENAKFLCDQYYMASPNCTFQSRNSYEKEAGNGRISMTYVPSHLYHMLFELLKNSMRAVVEFHADMPELPNIHVLISKGREDVTVKISDQGGGIRRSEQDLLFNYLYSTAPQPPSPDAGNSAPLAGYGYGLPLSRLYAKYFNGDLWLNSVDGHGTDAMISLKVLPCDATELLPIYNKTSSSKYSKPVQVGDWSDTHHGQQGFSSKKFMPSQSAAEAAHRK